ncbi:hypothetical protein [Halobacillus sp. A5]|uniref:hypothetical protein n=1 Tax=Halobacillus sp. A5 TaxID=2880263 RepID=UPI0020A62642|nr:hypothetical protein [Halobacillus sp. A5]MCP3029463.1 hypothetical protein [Halobacillus sp. A5]
MFAQYTKGAVLSERSITKLQYVTYCRKIRVKERSILVIGGEQFLIDAEVTFHPI